MIDTRSLVSLLLCSFQETSRAEEGELHLLPKRSFTQLHSAPVNLVGKRTQVDSSHLLRLVELEVKDSLVPVCEGGPHGEVEVAADAVLILQSSFSSACLVVA